MCTRHPGTHRRTILGNPDYCSVWQVWLAETGVYSPSRYPQENNSRQSRLLFSLAGVASRDGCVLAIQVPTGEQFSVIQTTVQSGRCGLQRRVCTHHPGTHRRTILGNPDYCSVWQVWLAETGVYSPSRYPQENNSR